MYRVWNPRRFELGGLSVAQVHPESARGPCARRKTPTDAGSRFFCETSRIQNTSHSPVRSTAGMPDAAAPRALFSQVEFCDNLIFRRRAALDKLGERLLDANRTIGQPNKISVIFGRRISKHYRGKLQTEIEDMDLPNPVIRSHYGNGFVKQYVRDHLMLRTEAASNNVNDYGVNKSVENLPALRNALAAINDNYLNVQQDILETFIDRGQLRKLAEPTITPTGKRIPGLKLDQPRQLALMHALVRFAHVAGGNTFTTAELYPRVLAALGCPAERYTLASLRYDLANSGQRARCQASRSRRYQLCAVQSA